MFPSGCALKDLILKIKIKLWAIINGLGYQGYFIIVAWEDYDLLIDFKAFNGDAWIPKNWLIIKPSKYW